ncbi:Cis-2,3-dihydrobiphenyl-2,3-diol dehydrogenase [Lecanosticta acicola]|uniref:Cis-2,3-dihydrobiphenyl-2,3-diol dehydrogenase n=1 Tax=Lecanosticta acicola TaxID=111012 RepID=A0AAI9ECK2_9PEZI|nr:Cis-2,3-dihydrobiphenyl-2,3-diol dehydrogenase [Lecanosticta acicola]
MSTPIALITGGGSGIGLAVAEHLINFHGYRVAIADVVAERVKENASRLGDDTCLPLHLDVTNYGALSKAFVQTFEWGGNRLDLFFGNAGIGDSDSLYKDLSIDETTGLPRPLNLRTLDVNLHAVLQGIHLARHFLTEKNQSPGGRIVVTSSAVGLYPNHSLPMYAASKHALVGLVRSLAPVYARDKISINALNPSLIETNLMPEQLRDRWTREQLTPMSTALKAFDAMLADPKMTGQTMELTLDDVVFTPCPDFQRPNTKWMCDQHELWESAMQDYMPRPPLQNAVFEYKPPTSL